MDKNLMGFPKDRVDLNRVAFRQFTYSRITQIFVTMLSADSDHSCEPTKLRQASCQSPNTFFIICRIQGGLFTLIQES